MPRYIVVLDQQSNSSVRRQVIVQADGTGSAITQAAEELGLQDPGDHHRLTAIDMANITDLDGLIAVLGLDNL